jgi:hypothetical protein
MVRTLTKGYGMKVVPLSLAQANDFVSRLHRHHKKSQGHKWSIGVVEGDNLVGVAITGRPVARLLDNGLTLEVTRVCTNGTMNACSMLYAACARAAKAMGYEKIQTYILESELGTSLKASGWQYEATTSGTGRFDKNRADSIQRREDNLGKKQRWVKYL